MSVRIVAGSLGGRRLQAPRGPATRPSAERTREALFAMLGPLDGLAVLDCFAGSGALGIEACSRGAARVTFVERARPALEALRANLRDLGLEDRCRVVARDWERALAAERAAGTRYDLVLVDPPYPAWGRVAPRLGPALAPLVRPSARVVLEYSGSVSQPPTIEGLIVTDRTDRRHGAAALAILTVGSAS